MKNFTVRCQRTQRTWTGYAQNRERAAFFAMMALGLSDGDLLIVTDGDLLIVTVNGGMGQTQRFFVADDQVHVADG